MKKSVYTFAVLAAALTLTACGGKKQSTQTDAKTPVESVKPSVKVAKVSARPVSQIRDYAGTIQAEVKNNIAPAAPGRIDAIFVEVGDHVRKGQKLVQMDAANLDQLTLQLENLRVEHERIKQLYAIGGVSKAEYDNMDVQLKVSETSYANLLENTQLLSPIDGIVTARSYDDGDLFSGTPILVVEQIKPVKLMINVSENYYSRVEKGDTAKVRLDAIPGQQFIATVNLKYPTVNPATHTFPVELTLQNSRELVRPGMFARAELNFGTENRVVVPDIAVVKQPGSGERFVYLYENGKVSYIRVELGQRLEDAYELLGGVPDGANVVVAGQSRLTDGVEVRVEK